LARILSTPSSRSEILAIAIMAILVARNKPILYMEFSRLCVVKHSGLIHAGDKLKINYIGRVAGFKPEQQLLELEIGI
jgi:hypothetical protein